MLNSYTIKHNTTVTPVTRVVEKTISPDKVTEMYDAVRKEVEEDIIAKVLVQDNFMNGVVLYMENRFDTVSKIILTKFNINGKEYIQKDYIVPLEEMDKYKLAEELRKKYVETMSTLVLRESVRDIFTKV